MVQSSFTPRRGRLARVLVAAAAAVALLAAARCSRESRDGMRIAAKDVPVVLISVDTLRADHLPVYGYRDVSTPNIDALARDSIVFEEAYSHVPLTFPSHVTLLTGLLPEQTGVRNNLGYRFDSAAHPTLPTLLKASGYSTGAFVSAYVLRGATGLAAAFDDYDDELDRSAAGSVGEIQRAGNETVERALAWIDAKKDKPFFLLFHLFEPHAPYVPPEPFLARYAASPYDGEIAASDAYVGTLIEKLKSSGLYDRSLIIFLSDHGEGLGDHGEEQHGIFLYREAIRVPLLVKLPKGEMSGARVKTPVALADVLPTVAEVTGFAVPPGAAGVSLVRIARGESPDRHVFSESMYPRIHLGWSDLASVVDARHHYIDAPRPELFDIVNDPRETRNILADERRVYAAMRKEIEGHDRRLELPKNVDPEEAAKLAALGYLGSTSSTPGSAALPDPKDGIADLNRIGESRGLIERGEHAKAISILRDLLARNPSFADGWTQLGKALKEQGRFDEALVAYKKTIEVAPMLAPGTALAMAEIYLGLGRFDECIKHAELALESHPGAARLLIARAYFAMKDLDSAEREAQQLGTLPTSRREAHILLAQIRTLQRRLPEAASLLEGVKAETEALGQQPLATFCFARGDLLVRMGKVPEAKESFRDEIKYYPRNTEAYVMLAVLQTLEGREDEANRTFEAMVKANPSRSSYTLAADTFRGLQRQGSASSWAARARTSG